MADTGICVVWSLQSDGADQAERPRLLCLYPDQDLEEALWDVIEVQNLEAALQAEFQITRPLWYGLWIDSPLSPHQCAVLYTLLSGVASQSILYRQELRPFLATLRQAGEGQGRLNVRLSPPGHTDFGIVTTFAHCPRCKAEAPFPCWQDYPSEPITCPVCSHTYSPTETHFKREYGDEKERKGKRVGHTTMALLIGWMLIRDGILIPWLEERIRRRRRRRRARREKRRG